MADKVEKDLEKALDESLDILAKAAKSEESEESKGDESEEAKGDKPAFLKKDDKKDEPEDAKGDKKEDEDDEMKGEKKEDEDEKSMRDGRKAAAHEALSKSETVSNAIEVSKFLREIVKSLADMNGELVHRVSRLEKSQAAFQDALAKSQSAQADVIKSFGADIAVAAKAPLPRKGVDAKDVKTIEKSMRNDEKGEEKTLSKSQIAEKLCSLEISGKVPYNTTAKFESTGELSKSFESLVYESK